MIFFINEKYRIKVHTIFITSALLQSPFPTSKELENTEEIIQMIKDSYNLHIAYFLLLKMNLICTLLLKELLSTGFLVEK